MEQNLRWGYSDGNWLFIKGDKIWFLGLKQNKSNCFLNSNKNKRIFVALEFIEVILINFMIFLIK